MTVGIIFANFTIGGVYEAKIFEIDSELGCAHARWCEHG
jgi:hypothetical protein